MDVTKLTGEQIAAIILYSHKEILVHRDKIDTLQNELLRRNLAPSQEKKEDVRKPETIVPEVDDNNV